jgi:hypothetical protein
MSDTDTQAPREEVLDAFFEKLVEFRQTLPEHEQLLVDMLVQSSADDEPSEDEEVVEPPVITEDEVESFTRNLEKFRGDLTDDDRRLLDSLSLNAGVAVLPEDPSDEDVSAHYHILWRRRGYGYQYNAYKRACYNNYGVQTFRSRYLYTSYYGRVYRYTCVD